MILLVSQTRQAVFRSTNTLLLGWPDKTNTNSPDSAVLVEKEAKLGTFGKSVAVMVTAEWRAKKKLSYSYASLEAWINDISQQSKPPSASRCLYQRCTHIAMSYVSSFQQRIRMQVRTWASKKELSTAARPARDFGSWKVYLTRSTLVNNFYGFRSGSTSRSEAHQVPGSCIVDWIH